MFHQGETYSTCRRTSVVYAAVRMPVCLDWMFLFKKPNVLFALAEIRLIGVFQLKSLLMISTHKCLSVECVFVQSWMPGLSNV